jgi:hypothetical protein
MMATATRGAAADREELPFDFFIRPNIPRPRCNGYFPAGSLEFLVGASPEATRAVITENEPNAQVRH